MEKHDWRALYEAEARLRNEVVLGNAQQLRGWWASLADLMGAAARQHNQKPLILPEPFLVVEQTFRDFSRGRIPKPVSDVALRGNPVPSVREEADIRVALVYHRSAKAGIVHNGHQVRVDDPHPTKTIAEAYAVRPGTVRGWVRTFQVVAPWLNDLTPELLESMMRKAGKRYAASGRSHAAVAARDRKRGASSK